MTTTGTTRTVRIDTLTPYGNNPRKGNVDAIRDSLETNGQFRPIVANETPHGLQILAGHHTVEAAKQLGWTELQAHVLKVDGATARRIMLADNRTSDLATYDLDDLAQELQLLDDLAGTGYEQDDLEAILDIQDDEPEQPADEYDGPYPYEGTRTITLHLMEPLFEQWERHAFAFDSPEEALEYLLDHQGGM